MVDASSDNKVEDPNPKISSEEGQDGDADLSDAAAEILLKDLYILPPLQKSTDGGVTNESVDAVALPPIPPEQTVASLRQALGDVSGTAHITHYRFIFDKEAKGSLIKEKKQLIAANSENSRSAPTDVVSPYTGHNAVISPPVAVKSLEYDPADKNKKEASDEMITLDDYGDLHPYIESGLQDGSCFRMLLERYDAASIRDHVFRLRNLFEGNVPGVSSLEDAPAASDDENDDISGDNVTAAPSTSSSHDKENKEVPNKDKEEQKASKDTEPSVVDNTVKEEIIREEANKTRMAAMAEKMPVFPPHKSIVVDGTNLEEFYHLACGEENTANDNFDKSIDYLDDLINNGQKKSKKKSKHKGKKVGTKDDDGKKKQDDEQQPLSFRECANRLNELEEKAHVKCFIEYSGFHPPPSNRRLVGDIAYLEITPPGYPETEEKINVTAIPTGFYVNRTRKAEGSNKFNNGYQFDPSPAKSPCFSHELLDCLLQHSKSLRAAWADALAAAKERTEITSIISESPLKSCFRVAVRGDYSGYQNPASISVAQGIDSVILRPTWLVPLPRASNNQGRGKNSEDATSYWNHNCLHGYNPAKAEVDLSDMFGLDVRGTSIRDWNEEIQTHREAPVSTLQERIERAKSINKVLLEFGEASVIGVKAIVAGHVAPMNPNEPTRSHVYFHNNIFFSRAVDAGMETLKIYRGDRASRKAVSREAQCIGNFHRMDISNLYSLATVLVDYLGTRFICQSIVPGILHGEKTHTVKYGAVESTSPVSWDKEVHESLEEIFGKLLMIATRNVPKMPLCDERMKEIKEAKTILFQREEPKEEDYKSTVSVCGPVELKGIQGCDLRNYILDINRITPRDANWVAKSEGGTGKWEAVMEEETAKKSNNGKAKRYIPESLNDEELTVAVLRPELISSLTQRRMAEYLRNKKKKKDENDGEKKKEIDKNADQNTSSDAQQKENDNTETTAGTGDGGTKDKDTAEEIDSKSKNNDLTEEDEEYLKSQRYNLNVFLPNLRSLEGIDDAAVAQLKKDEDHVREAATFLWDEVLPKITKDMRDGTSHQIPLDGKNLTDFLHNRGVNCRYLGRLAVLAGEAEERDRYIDKMAKGGQVERLPRRVMPKCWLELLECEMVARAAKHVLDSYLTENSGRAAIQPAQTIASFLSALMSVGEETAAQTETRYRKEESDSASELRDEDDYSALTLFGVGELGDSSQIRSRAEVWDDIEKEVGLCFRYTLTLYNNSGSPGRALYIPLLRRFCQKAGIRLEAKNYAVGGRCLCSAGAIVGGRLTASYPISPLDIIDVVPLVKHAAAQNGEGFVPYCAGNQNLVQPSLHIVLPDAKANMDAAHLHYQNRQLNEALDLANEATTLYQTAAETHLHANVARCLDLTSAILFEANQPHHATATANRALGYVVQMSGFDSAEAMTAHSTLSHILLTYGGLDGGVKHTLAAIYLMELMAGPRYVELSNAYHKLGTLYHEMGDTKTALRFYQEASSRHTCDRLMEGMIAKSSALVLAAMKEYKQAVDSEKHAYRIYSQLVGPEHELTKSSANTLKKFVALSVEQGTKKVQEDKKRHEEEVADAIARKIEADEENEEKKKKKKKKKKK